jgi:hypothetical protein
MDDPAPVRLCRPGRRPDRAGDVHPSFPVVRGRP